MTVRGVLRTYGADSRVLGHFYSGIGSIYYDLGMLPPARDHLLRCLALAETHKDLRTWSVCLRYLSSVALKEGHKEEALLYATHAIEAATSYFGGSSPELAHFLTVEARALAASGRREQAFR